MPVRRYALLFQTRRLQPHDIDARLLHDAHTFAHLEVGWLNCADKDAPHLGVDAPHTAALHAR